MLRSVGLRLRLTLSYVLLFALILVLVGLLFRQSLERSLEAQDEAILSESWAAVRGYLRIDEDGRNRWTFDTDDPAEGYIVEHLRQVLLLADVQGNVLEISDGYRVLGGVDPVEIAAARASHDPVYRRKSPNGTSYLLRQGIIREGNRDFFLAIGQSVNNTEKVLHDFTRAYFLLVPLLLCGVAGLVWLLAGTALQPLNEVVAATQKISSENLGYRLPARGTGDELDVLTKTFNAMLERLEHSFVKIRQFNVDASHELRTPITAIRGQLEVALFTARGDEDYRRAIETALQDVERMGQVVKSMLLLSEAESGQVALEKALMDLAPATEELVHQFQVPANEKGVRLTPLISPGAWAEVDPVQYERMLANLVSNAIKFTPREGEVRVALTHGAGQVFLTVSDTGRGIAPEHIAHIFNRFYRVVHSENEAEKGLGMGLSFVDWIVAAHGGTIEVKSTVGQGATFLVTLPSGSKSVPFSVLRDNRPPQPRTC
jgi:heavy metal sensor kinase